MIMLILGLPSCKKGEEAFQNITVVLDWVPNTNHAGIYIARQKGYYNEQGLKVEIIQPSEGGSADLIAAGKGEFGISYQEQVTYARTTENPLPVIAIAAIIQHNTSGFASPVEKNIKTPADFEGKKYGGWGSPMEEAMLKGLMEKYNADYSKLEIVNIGASDFFTSIERDIDFAWIFYGWDGIKSELDKIPINFILLQDIDAQLDFYTPLIIASENTIDQNPDLVEKFLSATEKGYLFAINNPEEAAELFLIDNDELDRQLVTASLEYLSGQYMGDSPKWGIMNKNIWDSFSNWMYENDLLQNRLESEKAFTNEFLSQ
jgi:ABC-type nitrate/sulfonate/bicarbonate transport system substrate-binding protein